MAAGRALALLGLVALLAAGPPSGCDRWRRARPNVLLVSIDTLRADALGVYGGPVPTPAFDGLAAEGALFEQAIAAAPETAPSHATLLSGQGVLRHGLVRNGVPLPDGIETLAEAFRDAGWATAGFVSAFVLDARFGWRQGFDTWDADFPREGETLHQRTPLWAQHEFEGFDRRAPATNARVLPWLAEAPEPFFLFVHYYDPHLPYLAEREQLQSLPRGPFARASSERIAALRKRRPGTRRRDLEAALRRYQAEVLFADAALGELLAALDARGIRGRTLVVVTADHGEGLGEHGTLDHAPHLYEEQLHVPLALRWPEGLRSGLRVPELMGLVDVAPTLAELAGVRLAGSSGAGDALDGRSWAPVLTGGAPAEVRPVLGRRRHYPQAFLGHRGTKFFVRTARWKYIRATEDRDELYDLAVDPEETNDLSGPRPQEAELAALLDARLAEHPVREPALELSEEDRRGLEALGYAEPAEGPGTD